MRNVFVAIFMASVLIGCTTIVRDVEHVTDLHGSQKSEYFTPGTYKYKRVALEASATGDNLSNKLGQIAMDKIVKEAALGPNQILVDMTIERGKVFGGKSGRDTLNVLTIRGDVIELGTPLRPSSKPDWGVIPDGTDTE
jgi:hypothetical protein